MPIIPTVAAANALMLAATQSAEAVSDRAMTLPPWERYGLQASAANLLQAVRDHVAIDTMDCESGEDYPGFDSHIYERMEALREAMLTAASHSAKQRKPKRQAAGGAA